MGKIDCELNQAIRELLVRLNERPFRKRDGSRVSLFYTLEKPALAPLPAERFDMSQWARAKVNIDYRVACDGNFYSVPYTLVQQVVEVRLTPTTVEIFLCFSFPAKNVTLAIAASVTTLVQENSHSRRCSFWGLGQTEYIPGLSLDLKLSGHSAA